MAHIFYGNAGKFAENGDVVDAVTRLGDEYWCLFEFDVPGANIDLLTIRVGDAGLGYSSLVNTEVKHISGVVTGGYHGAWSVERKGETTPFLVPNKRDLNPWDQTVRAHDELVRRLEELRGEYLDFRPDRADIAVWPHLLLVRNDGPGIHNLPDQPTSFGTFSFSLQKWLRRIEGWKSKQGLIISAAEVEALTQCLDLTRWDPVALPIAKTAIHRHAAASVAPAAPQPQPVLPVGDPRLDEMFSLVSAMSEELRVIKQAVTTPPVEPNAFSWKKFLAGRK